MFQNIWSLKSRRYIQWIDLSKHDIRWWLNRSLSYTTGITNILEGFHIYSNLKSHSWQVKAF